MLFCVLYYLMINIMRHRAYIHIKFNHNLDLKLIVNHRTLTQYSVCIPYRILCSLQILKVARIAYRIYDSVCPVCMCMWHLDYQL